MTNFKSGQPDQSNTSWQAEYLKTALSEGIVKVLFVKKDGTERTMLCTLKADLLPQEEVQESTEPKKTPNPDVMRVWDTEKAAWRSFRVDSVIGFSERVL